MNGPTVASRARWPLAAAAVCFAIDCAKHGWLMWAGPVQPWPDSDLYWQLGRDVAAGDWWLVQSAVAARTPAYPWFLGACQLIGGQHGLWLAVVCQHVLELSVSALTAATVWQVTKSARTALAAYGACVLLTARCLFANAVLSESWATFLLVLLAWLCSRQLSSPRISRLCLAAVVLGLSILLRPAAAAFVPALLWVAWQQGSSLAIRGRNLAAALGICAAIVIPWCVRNQIVWNRFTITVFAGRELWTANFSPWTGAHLPFPDSESGRRLQQLLAGQSVNLEHNWLVFAALSRAGLNEVEADDLMQAVARDAMRRDPGRVAVHIAARCLSFWYVKEWEFTSDTPPQSAWRDQIGWSTPWQENALRAGLRFTPERSFPAMWVWAAVTWFGVAGMMVHAPYRSFGVTLGGLMLGLMLLTATLEIPYYRYRCVLEPIMVMAAIIGLQGWTRTDRPKREF